MATKAKNEDNSKYLKSKSVSQKGCKPSTKEDTSKGGGGMKGKKK